MAEQIKSSKRCYNCGCEFTDDNKETVEHIPMQALYAGYSPEYKINRITVPLDVINVTMNMQRSIKN